MDFLEKSISEILKLHHDFTDVKLVLPGKRPIVFIKKILQKENFSGILPQFYTIEELILSIAQTQQIKGIALWLFAYKIYSEIYPGESLSDFLKWFPTLLKDWDDILKFADNEKQVLQYMLDEERIKNWGETLGEDTPRKRNLDFWRKINQYLPLLRKELEKEDWATLGMLNETASKKIQEFSKTTSDFYIFLGFNAFTPTEKNIVKTLLKEEKASCYFQGDEYYCNNEKQEAGKFLREYKTWKEFEKEDSFKWIENDFSKAKTIKQYDIPGNISQTKVLPEILNSDLDLSETAVILLDENLLPAALDSLSSFGSINITMGFPLKNLSFSNAVKQVFHLQKQLTKKKSYYYNDVLAVLEEIPKTEKEKRIIEKFIKILQEKNIVYFSEKFLGVSLSELSFFELLKKQDSYPLLDIWINFCDDLKYRELQNDILYENISLFEKNFKIIKNQLQLYGIKPENETLEVLIAQLINSESIDFQGEPLEGLQVMGLLETRLLNFKNTILLSVNEGKLPLGNSQNTYLPFDVRKQFGLNTFLENDSIYAYHFYRLLQNSKNIHLLYNSLNSGVSIGEKSRFITQLEIESPHHIEQILIENPSEPSTKKLMAFEKNHTVIEQLETWKKRVSVSHLTKYLYNPADFYFSKVLGLYESDEIEEELSDRNYGNLIHKALQFAYQKYKGKLLTTEDLKNEIQESEKTLDSAILDLKYQLEYYERGINYIQKNLALKVINDIFRYDLELLENNNSLEIIDIEKKFEDIPMEINSDEKVLLYGYIDRIDLLNGQLRIIDYKTGKTKDLSINLDENKKEKYFFDKKKKQAMQLCLYHFVVSSLPEFSGKEIQTGIWSFAETKKGMVGLDFKKGNLDDALVSIKNLILEILNPEIPFIEAPPAFENN